MKTLCLIILSLFCLMKAEAQSPGNPTQINNTRYYSFKQFLGSDSAFLMPQRDTNWLPSRPAMIFRPGDSTVYYWNLRYWTAFAKAVGPANLGIYLLKANFIDSLNNNRQQLSKLGDTVYLSFGGKVNVMPDTTTKVATINFVKNQGYIKTETDPVFSGSPAFGITTININNWNSAFNNATFDSVGKKLRLFAINGAQDSLVINSVLATNFNPVSHDSTIITAGTGKVYGDTLRVMVDTTHAIATHNWALNQGFIKSETDPVATAKTITMVNGSGVTIFGSPTQTLGSNPTWTFKADTGLVATLAALGDSVINKKHWDSAFVKVKFDTSSRVLTMYDFKNDSAFVVIPKGGTQNGMVAINTIRYGDILKIYADNGASTEITINNQDSLTRAHFGDTTTYFYPLKSNPAKYIPLTALSALVPLSYVNTTGVFSIDTSGAANGMATINYVNRQGYVKTETDPVATAKTVTVTAGTGITVTGAAQTVGSNPSFTVAAQNTTAIWNANQLQGTPVSTTPPSINQLLQYNGTNWIGVTPSYAPAFTVTTPLTYASNVLRADTSSNSGLVTRNALNDSISNIDTLAFVLKWPLTLSSNGTIDSIGADTTTYLGTKNFIKNWFSGGSGISVNNSTGVISIPSASVTNSMLVNSTISGISLGGTLSSVTFNNSGSGAASGTVYNGSAPQTISYNTIGAAPAFTVTTPLTYSSNVLGEDTTTAAHGMASINYVQRQGYLTANQSITVTASGDATGSGSGNTAITLPLTLANSGVTAGGFTRGVVNAKGLITSATDTAYQIAGTYVNTFNGRANAVVPQVGDYSAFYQPLENQRLSTGNSPTFNNEVITGNLSFGTNGGIVGSSVYQFLVNNSTNLKNLLHHDSSNLYVLGNIYAGGNGYSTGTALAYVNGSNATGTWPISITGQSGAVLQTFSGANTNMPIMLNGGAGLVYYANSSNVYINPSTGVLAAASFTDGGLISASFVATNGSGTFIPAAYTPYNPASYPVNAGGETLQSVTTRGATTTLGITALKFITSGGLSSQFVKGDGSLDGTAYAPASGSGNYIQNTATQQPSSSFYVSGTGDIGGIFTAHGGSYIRNTGTYVYQSWVQTNTSSWVLSVANADSIFRLLRNNSNGLQSDLYDWSYTGNYTNAGTITASGFYNSSDTTLKHIYFWNPSRDGIESIIYSWKKDPENKVHWGYAAQQVQKILPNAVITGTDNKLKVDYNEVHTYKIAELEKDNKQLTDKVDSLESKLDNMQKEIEQIRKRISPHPEYVTK